MRSRSVVPSEKRRRLSRIWTLSTGRTPSIPLPERVFVVLAQRLFVEKVGLPSPLLNQIKRLAAFQNPEFYKKQSMRLFTAMTLRVISCAEDLPQHVVLLRGCRGDLEELLGGYGAALMVADQRTEGVPLDLRFHGTLIPAQEQAARALLAYDIGVLVAPRRSADARSTGLGGVAPR